MVMRGKMSGAGVGVGVKAESSGWTSIWTQAPSKRLKRIINFFIL
jgi:hypothetical protein